MVVLSDGGVRLPRLSGQVPREKVNMDLTMCGLLVERAEELVQLYKEHGNWNDVKQVWFEERISNRSTRGSSQKIYRILTSRFKNAPASLPNPSDLPGILDRCVTVREKAQVLYLYLVADDALVRYAVHEYVDRMISGHEEPLEFSNEILMDILSSLEFEDGTSFDYADSTTRRWCEGFRSVTREIGVLESQKEVVGTPPTLDDVPLLVATGYSYEEGDDGWTESPTGLLYLLQPKERWDELYDRAAGTDSWEFVELHSDLRLQPTDDPYSWVDSGSGGGPP